MSAGVRWLTAVSHAHVWRPADGRRALGVRHAGRRLHARANATDGDDDAAAVQARAARRAKREEQMATKPATLGGVVKMVDKAVEERCAAEPHPLRREQGRVGVGHPSIHAGVVRLYRHRLATA